MKRIFLIIFFVVLVGCIDNSITQNNENSNNVLAEEANQEAHENDSIEDALVDETLVDKDVDEKFTSNEFASTSTNDSGETVDKNEMETEEFTEYVQVLVDVLNVRENPGVDSEKISAVGLNDIYEAIGFGNLNSEIWYQIECFEGTVGWIAGEYCIAVEFDDTSDLRQIYENHSKENKRTGLFDSNNCDSYEVIEHWIINDSKTEVWYKVKCSNGLTGFTYQSDFNKDDTLSFNKLFIVSDDQVLFNQETEESITITKLINNNAVVTSKESTLINLDTGYKYDFESTWTTTDDDSMFVIFQDINDYFFSHEVKDDFIILDLDSENFDVLYHLERPLLYVDFVSNPVINETVFEIRTLSEDPWSCAEIFIIEEEAKLVGDGKDITLEFIESNYLVIDKESMIVYEEMDCSSNVISELHSNEADKIDFMNTFDIIDHELVLWFEVQLKDGTIGYAYRPKRDSENDHIRSIFDLEFMLENGHSYNLKNEYCSSWNHYFIRDEFVLLGYYMYTYCFEGADNFSISFRDGTLSALPMDSDYILSESKRTMIEINNVPSNDSCYIKLFQIGESNLLEVFVYEEEFAFIDRIREVSDAEIEFYVNYRDEEHLRTIKLYKDSWILLDDKKL